MSDKSEVSEATATVASEGSKATAAGYVATTLEVAAPNSAKADTSYVLLRQDSGGWTVVHTRVDARSAEAAVLWHAEANPPEGAATFVAVPLRSWKPVTVTTKTTTTVVLGDPA